jgi:hypothetical protein
VLHGHNQHRHYQQNFALLSNGADLPIRAVLTSASGVVRPVAAARREDDNVICRDVAAARAERVDCLDDHLLPPRVAARPVNLEAFAAVGRPAHGCEAVGQVIGRRRWHVAVAEETAAAGAAATLGAQTIVEGSVVDVADLRGAPLSTVSVVALLKVGNGKGDILDSAKIRRPCAAGLAAIMVVSMKHGSTTHILVLDLPVPACVALGGDGMAGWQGAQANGD